ncbi:MAG: orotidine 5-phosphate decarboxylase [Betaproteobacteria bacterium]|jgi:orotidine-5'-phosphate decarboxylase|nr:orotidine 5-phosphate decarboxylase [Betaproteobacteria bacterium]
MSSRGDPKIIVALDFADADSALDLAARLDPAQCRLKVGQELFTAAGPAFVEQLVGRGFGVFLDLKFHDIPNTVAAACRAAARLGVWMLNVHASGGRAMLRAARDAVPGGPHSPKLIAVTVLTSMSAADLSDIAVRGTPEEVVSSLARLTMECALDGVVCSALEVAHLRESCGSSFCLVTPGIRPANAATNDQQRVMTPAAAIAAGASYLVIGRPITRAPDPLAALRQIDGEIASTMRPR